MKYGVRDICDVVLRAKARMQVGNKVFYRDEPVIYFDTLTTSSLEGASTTVYAQRGRGNTPLMAWEGERTVTFTMEDALISPESFMILSGAGLMEATKENTIKQHMSEKVDVSDIIKISDGLIAVPVSNRPYVALDGEGEEAAPIDNYIYMMLMRDGEIISEPYIPIHDPAAYRDNENADFNWAEQVPGAQGKWYIFLSSRHVCYDADHEGEEEYVTDDINKAHYDAILVDYYTERSAGAKQIDITPDSFGGNFYLEASTLFRDQRSGVDMPAEFIIPNCKIQSNFTFTMAATGDPSSFTFTMDAFPDYTRFDHSKKVLAALQVFETADGGTLERHRGATHQIAQSWYDRGEDGAGADVHENLQEIPPRGSKPDGIFTGFPSGEGNG